MFNIDKTPTFTVPVPLVLEGLEEPQSFRATFRAVSDQEALEADAKSVDGFKAFLRRIVVRLHDLEDDEGNPVESSPEVIEQLLGFQHVRMALQRAYWGAMLKARLGN
jgi:hypothetical protein